MIRSVARVSARVTVTVTKPTHLRTITPVTPHLLRSFATSSSSSSTTSTSTSTPTSSSSSTSLTSTSSASPPANLRTLRRDLSRLLDEDAADLASAPDPGLLEYIKEQRFKVQQDKDTGVVRLTRTVGDYTVNVAFMPEVDDSMQEGEGEEGAEGEEGEEGKVRGKEGEGEEEDGRLPSHAWEVELTSPSATPNTIRLHCLTSKNGQMSLESVELNPSTSPQPGAASADPFNLSGDPSSRLFFDELSDAVQDKTYELLTSLGVDDKLGQFVQHYAQVVRTQGFLDKIKTLKTFLG